MLNYVMGIMALIVFLYRILFLMIPMMYKSTSLGKLFQSFTLLV